MLNKIVVLYFLKKGYWIFPGILMVASMFFDWGMILPDSDYLTLETEYDIYYFFVVIFTAVMATGYSSSFIRALLRDSALRIAPFDANDILKGILRAFNFLVLPAFVVVFIKIILLQQHNVDMYRYFPNAFRLVPGIYALFILKAIVTFWGIAYCFVGMSSFLVKATFWIRVISFPILVSVAIFPFTLLRLVEFSLKNYILFTMKCRLELSSIPLMFFPRILIILLLVLFVKVMRIFAYKAIQAIVCGK